MKAGKKKNKAPLVIIITVVLVAAIAASFYFYNTFSSRTVVGNPAIMSEIARLASLSNSEQITVSDVDSLKSMIAGDAAAEHEVEELELLVRHNEYVHAGHTLAFLGAYIVNGKEVLCPGHLVAHYYVFYRNGELHQAEHALEDAKSQIGEWSPIAREFNERFPGGYSFEYLSDYVTSHIEAIETGNNTASDEEINFLAEKTICVQGESAPSIQPDEEHIEE